MSTSTYELELAESHRPKWSRHLEFVVTIIGFAVGLGNVWRFPYLCYEYGGGAFLIPYFICLLLLGIPMFFLEVVFGQFSSKATLGAWEINPLFKGLGYTMIWIVSTIVIFYAVIISVAIYFLVASMQTTLPWSTCGNEWNTCYCRTDDMDIILKDPLIWFHSVDLDCSGINFTKGNIKSPSAEYYFKSVLQLSSGIDEPGGLLWLRTLCHLFVWGFVLAAISQGIKSMGKVVYVSALLPYVLMTSLLIRSVFLPGAARGISYYMTFDFSKVLIAQVWKEAASQILFSLSCCMGALMTMSSYNDFHANSIRDSFMVPIINCCTSFYVGFAVFAVLGFMAESQGKEVSDVAANGPGLVFVVYPTALAKMPLPQLWSFLFFLMMVLLGMGSLMPMVETIITAFQDEFPKLRRPKYTFRFRAFMCSLGFLLGLPQLTEGGWYLLGLCDEFITMPMLLLGLFQVISIIWIYGPKRFSEDMNLMLGFNQLNITLYNLYFKGALIVATPLLLLFILIYNFINYKSISEKDAYPDWAEGLGWLLFTFMMIWTPAWYIVAFVRKGGLRGGLKKLIELNQPTKKWGPAHPEHRTIPRYQEFVPEITQNEDELMPLQEAQKSEEQKVSDFEDFGAPSETGDEVINQARTSNSSNN